MLSRSHAMGGGARYVHAAVSGRAVAPETEMFSVPARDSGSSGVETCRGVYACGLRGFWGFRVQGSECPCSGRVEDLGKG